MIQYCISYTASPWIVDRQTGQINAPQPLQRPGNRSQVPVALPRTYQAAVRDLRVEAVSITASAKKYGSAIMN